MDNKNVGYLVLGIAVFLIAIIFLFNSALKEIIAVGCDVEHGIECPMYDSVNQQTYLALGIVGILILLGLILVFTKPNEKIIIKKIKDKKKKLNFEGLDKNEKRAVEILQGENSAMFQS